jgi:hypothetical protein
MRRVLLCFLVATFCHQISARAQSTCAQTLRLAQSVYEQGRLQELPNLLEGCLRNGFSDQEKVNAYKLLTLTYIYLEEPAKADENMLLLLQTNNEFKPNDAVDPAEFVAIYNTFRTWPIYRLGLKAGTIAAQPSVISSDYVNSGSSTYKYAFGFTLAVAGEIPLKGIFRKFYLNPELSFQSRNFTSTNSKGDTVRTTTSTETQNWISVPISLQHDVFSKGDNFKIFAAGGLAPEYLISAKKKLLSERTGFSPVEERELSLNEVRNPFNIGLLASAGIKKKISKGYLIVELRYQYSLLPALKSEDVYGQLTSIIDYKTVDGVYRVNTLSVSVGYVLNRYNPKKLIR